MFKIVNNLISIIFNDHLSYCKTVTCRNHPQKLNILAPRTDTYKFSFFPRTIPELNSMPAFVASTSSVNTFSVFAHRGLCAYFLRIERVVGNAYVSLVDTDKQDRR